MIREIPIRVGKKEYTFKLGANAVSRFEREAGMPFGKFAVSLSNPENLEMRLVRAVLWAGLKDSHPDITIDTAGNMIDDIGFTGAIQIMVEAMNEFFPTPTGETNPPEAIRHGIGNGS